MQRLFKITVNGTAYDVAVEELTSNSSQLMPNYTGTVPPPPTSNVAPHIHLTSGAAPTIPAGSGNQYAQMSGVVASILVKEGQSINEGDRIMELEAMKMKVPVMANCSGKISRILVSVGEAVSGGQALATIA